VVNIFKIAAIKLRYFALLLSFIAWLILALPKIQMVLQQNMLSHMLLQIPLLILIGIIIGLSLNTRYHIKVTYSYALPGLLIASFSLLFWMLPRSLDASLSYPSYAVAKFTTLPLLIGIPLALCWHAITAITKGFFITQIISMLMVLAWLYIESPIRLCNYYLINEQQQLGYALLFLTLFISIYYSSKLFYCTHPSSRENTTDERQDVS